MKVLVLKAKRKLRRKRHIIKSMTFKGDRLRLTVFKSLNHIYAQIIDDKEQKTLVSASTIDKEVKSQITSDMKKSDKSVLVGKLIAKRAKEANISNVAFDRNGYIYHGRVKALADGAREGGLQF
ncbi:MAG TPA: 50S ribosomal protein L18 [Candidatus Kapabacteria bacterium]|nr:50S ribosomal protein L18 [Candidatus Kapabacteria bacterium]